MEIKKLVARQIIAPIQQWLLEQGKCAVCGGELPRGKKITGEKGERVTCSCGQAYLYLPEAKLYKRLARNQYP